MLFIVKIRFIGKKSIRNITARNLSQNPAENDIFEAKIAGVWTKVRIINIEKRPKIDIYEIEYT